MGPFSPPASHLFHSTNSCSNREADGSASELHFGVVEQKGGFHAVGTCWEGFQERLSGESSFCMEGCETFTSSSVLWTRRCARHWLRGQVTKTWSHTALCPPSLNGENSVVPPWGDQVLTPVQNEGCGLRSSPIKRSGRQSGPVERMQGWVRLGGLAWPPS